LNNVIVRLESLFTTNITEKTKCFTVEGTEMVGEVDKPIVYSPIKWWAHPCVLKHIVWWEIGTAPAQKVAVCS
jgi:hypothetical protein